MPSHTHPLHPKSITHFRVPTEDLRACLKCHYNQSSNQSPITLLLLLTPTYSAHSPNPTTHAPSLSRLEATDSPGVRYALCAIASELCKGDAGLARLRDINFAQALERLRSKKSLPKDAALEIIIDHLVQELRPRIA